MADDNKMELPEPLTVPHSSYVAEKTPFLDLDEIKDWASHNLQAWKQHPPSLPRISHKARLLDLRAKPFENIIELLEPFELRGKATSAQLRRVCNAVSKELASISEGASFTVDSAFGRLAFRGQLTDWEALGLFAAAFGLESATSDDATIWVNADQNARIQFAGGFHLGLALSHKSPPAAWQQDLKMAEGAGETAKEVVETAKSMLRAEAANYEAWDKRRSARLSEIRQAAMEALEESRAEYRELVSEHQAEMQRLRTAFEEFTRTHDAATYWGDRSRNAGRTAVWSALVFVLLAAGIIYGIVTVGPSYLDLLPNSPPGGGDGAPIASTLLQFAFVSLPAGLLFWILRIPSRLFRENLHLMNDARHRHMLITTYISLLGDERNAMSPAEREIALSNIFNPPSELREEESKNPMFAPGSG